MTHRYHPDVRRRVAYRTRGVARVLVTAQAQLEDVVGAVDAAQFAVAAIAGRQLILECLAIRGINDGGQVAWPPGAVSFDPFAHASGADRATAVALMNTGASLTSVEDGRRWAEELAQLLRAVCTELGFDDPLPVLRSRDGMFSAIRLVKDAVAVVDRMRLGSVFPEAWAKAVPTGHRVTDV